MAGTLAIDTDSNVEFLFVLIFVFNVHTVTDTTDNSNFSCGNVFLRLGKLLVLNAFFLEPLLDSWLYQNSTWRRCVVAVSTGS